MRHVVQATASPVIMTCGISINAVLSVSTEAAEFALCVCGYMSLCMLACMCACLCMLYVHATAQCTLINA